MLLLRAGAFYFGLTFAVGCVLGPIRVLVLEPAIGTLGGAMAEAPFMIAAMAAIARWTQRQCGIATSSEAMGMGLVGLAFLLVVEMLSTILLRGVPLHIYLRFLLTPAGFISLLLFALFAVMPSLIYRRLNNATAHAGD